MGYFTDCTSVTSISTLSISNCGKEYTDPTLLVRGLQADSTNPSLSGTVDIHNTMESPQDEREIHQHGTLQHIENIDITERNRMFIHLVVQREPLGAVPGWMDRSHSLGDSGLSNTQTSSISVGRQRDAYTHAPQDISRSSQVTDNTCENGGYSVSALLGQDGVAHKSRDTSDNNQPATRDVKDPSQDATDYSDGDVEPSSETSFSTGGLSLEVQGSHVLASTGGSEISSQDTATLPDNLLRWLLFDVGETSSLDMYLAEGNAGPWNAYATRTILET
jgi:hypothetical protein